MHCAIGSTQLPGADLPHSVTKGASDKMKPSRPAIAAGLRGKPCVVVLLVGLASIRFTTASQNRTAVLDSILNGYDLRIRPDVMVETAEGTQEPNEDLPLRVRVGIYVESVDSIKESTMDFSVTLYLRQFWQDPRLAFIGNRSLVLGSNGVDKIWVPDIYFLHEKSARVHTVTQPNKLMNIQPNGHVSFSQRISLTVSCNMQLHKFPMDAQTCSIVMSTYAYPTTDLMLHVDNRSISMEPNITISKFRLTGMGVKQDTLVFSLGNYSCVSCHFYFMRQMESYFLTVYIPTVLLVTIAWLSFWIDANAAPARVALGITTVLTVTTMTAGIQETLPVVTYAKAIDIWLVVCLMFVFFALLEYGMANFLIVKQANAASAPEPTHEATKGGRTQEGGPQELSLRKPALTAKRLDWCARWAYPIAFLTFALCYWIIFLSM